MGRNYYWVIQIYSKLHCTTFSFSSAPRSKWRAITNITNYLIIKSNIVDYTCEWHAFAPQPHTYQRVTHFAGKLPTVFLGVLLTHVAVCVHHIWNCLCEKVLVDIDLHISFVMTYCCS